MSWMGGEPGDGSRDLFPGGPVKNFSSKSIDRIKSLNVYYFTMNKAVPRNRLVVKAICMTLALTFGVGFIATGVMANPGCGMKCCCLSKPMTRHHTDQAQIRSSMGCCSGASQMPCDLVPATERRLPEITLASSAGYIPTAAGETGTFYDDLIDRYGLRGHAFDQFAREKFRSPPLYLQNLSLLI